jgi:prepilin signal peptidase PulO-like enzyme (type II secretory pathway)
LARVQVPFGPFLSLAAILYLFVGDAVLRTLTAGLDD